MKNSKKNSYHPNIISKKNHKISYLDVSKHAMKVVKRLKSAGFQAYVVGGGVRDLLLNLPPKDFDVVTDAKPQQIKRIFSNCRLIGRRFRLAHIYFYRDVIEVATFRAGSNIYGSMEEDVWRRDFTVNALYYDPDQEIIVDFVDGMRDLKKKKISVIGDVKTRFCEDPVRILRAIRFAAKLNFKMEKEIQKNISNIVQSLDAISPCRLYDEVLKLFYCGESLKVFSLLKQYQVFDFLFPKIAPYLESKKNKKFIKIVLESTDQRIKNQQPIIAAFLFAALFWFPYLNQYYRSKIEDSSEIFGTVKLMNIPYYVRSTVQEIWVLQDLLERRKPRLIFRILKQKRFRAAFDFLWFRSQVDKSLKPVANWWQEIQKTSIVQRQKMIENLK